MLQFTIPPTPATIPPYTRPPGYTLSPAITDIQNRIDEANTSMIALIASLTTFLTTLCFIAHCCGVCNLCLLIYAGRHSKVKNTNPFSSKALTSRPQPST